ncbi:hypothetical protein NLJ89_g1432 [Agrocybe chaxingu]|uniref:Uncharacterized protein n=1 Tax=Agrocybe chaxingu TaxID=84603 RepID=A0A9W8MZZ6_9AGAR|nr:hypothetical protein NLJ89_g1432 [Agrocybe chaxingu]
MFTKTQFIAATVVLASTLSANAAPTLGQEGSLEASRRIRKGRAGKVRQAHEIAAVEHHKASEPHHHAVAHGNTAHVHDTFHSTHGGPDHATVKYSNPQGHHVTTLHIAKDGTRLQGGAHPPTHHSGHHAPPNSPKRRSLEASGRTHGNGGWITPAPGKGRAGKIRQAHEIAAVEHHKASEPHHHAVAHGNKAHVLDTFHSTHGGPDHVTVKYSNAHGHHVSTLHIAKDGTRLQGDAHPPAHHSGTHAPPNSPRELSEYIELLERALELYDDLD